MTTPESSSSNGGPGADKGDENGLQFRPISSNGLTDEGIDLDALRRTLDPDHPDPERLRQRVRSVLIATQLPGADAEHSLEATVPRPIDASPTSARPRARSIVGTTTLVAAVIVLVALVVAAVVVIRGHEHGTGD